MGTVYAGLRRHYFKRILFVLTLILLILLIGFVRGPTFGAIIEGLSPPTLPPIVRPKEHVYLQQNWPKHIRERYHHISQGTRTLPLPLSWLLALEQPHKNLLALPFFKQDKFIDNDYLLRFGFIKSPVSSENPYGLPIGFAVTPMQNLPGISNQTTAIGFTCAACHTGKLHYDNTEYIIDGGPAVTDLGQLTKALGAALGQTLIASKIPILNGRFERFAKNVLGTDAYNQANVLMLYNDLESLVTELAQLPATVEVVEGFTRLDALNRIGNQVFALDPHRFDNYVAIDAPVNYPHIWTASWFDWVQYDGSIMQPLVRNTGEAMGVSAFLNTTAPKTEQRFSESIPMDNLWWIESALGGESPFPLRKFNGLLSPKWPDTFPPIDKTLAETGQQLYDKHCKGCHLPTLDSDEIWSDKYFSPITYYVDGQEKQTADKLLKLKLIPLEQIGTDAAQAKVLMTRDVNTAGNASGSRLTNTEGLGIDTEICTWSPTLPQPADLGIATLTGTDLSKPTSRLVNVPIKDGPNLNFGLALGGIVQMVNYQWFAQNYIAKEDWPYYEGGRPNCLQVGKGYKARPLNGVWATAPFLHNGSVPTVMDLLSPPESRPELVLLGNAAFDPTNLGITQKNEAVLSDKKKYTRQGYFVLDTKVRGNHNSGHEFSDRWQSENPWYNQPQGVIGPALSEQEKLALIEFIKTL